MRSAVKEFYKRFHGIEAVNEDMQIDIDCMESFLYTIMDTYDDSAKLQITRAVIPFNIKDFRVK